MTQNTSTGPSVETEHSKLDRLAREVESRVRQRRHHPHANPELPNREVHTAVFVADLLRRLGLDEVRTGVASTGVVAVLPGGSTVDHRTGPVARGARG